MDPDADAEDAVRNAVEACPTRALSIVDRASVRDG